MSSNNKREAITLPDIDFESEAQQRLREACEESKDLAALQRDAALKIKSGRFTPLKLPAKINGEKRA